MMNEISDVHLNKEYSKAYDEVSAALKRSIPDRCFLNEVLDDFAEMLHTSQQEGRRLEDVLPNGSKGFVDDIEKTYYKEIPKKDVYLGLLGNAFKYIAILCLIINVQWGDSMLVLTGVPAGLIYAVLMHFIFGNFKNSKLRNMIDFTVYLLTYIIGFEIFKGAAKVQLPELIILLMIAGFGIAGHVFSSKRNMLGANNSRG